MIVPVEIGSCSFGLFLHLSGQQLNETGIKWSRPRHMAVDGRQPVIHVACQRIGGRPFEDRLTGVVDIGPIRCSDVLHRRVAEFCQERASGVTVEAALSRDQIICADRFLNFGGIDGDLFFELAYSREDLSVERDQVVQLLIHHGQLILDIVKFGLVGIQQHP